MAQVLADLVWRLVGDRKGENVSGRAGISRGGLTQGGHGKRRSISATVPAVPTLGVWSTQPARSSEPVRTQPTVFRSSAPRTLAPTSSHTYCPTAPYHVMIWYIPGMRTRVPSFGQTSPNKVCPCQFF